MARIDFYYKHSFVDAENTEVVVCKSKDDEKVVFFYHHSEELLSFSIKHTNMHICNHIFGNPDITNEYEKFWHELSSINDDLMYMLAASDISDFNTFPLEYWDTVIMPLKNNKKVDICNISCFEELG